MSPEQFPMMSVRRLLKLPSVDSDPLLAAAYGNSDRGMGDLAKARYRGTPDHDVESAKKGDIAYHARGYAPLVQAMRAGGPDAIPPLHVAKDASAHYGGNNIFPGRTQLGNGGHRLAIAHQLGWTHMRVTPNIYESGDDFKGLAPR